MTAKPNFLFKEQNLTFFLRPIYPFAVMPPKHPLFKDIVSRITKTTI
jgi:hypothetical protein